MSGEASRADAAASPEVLTLAATERLARGLREDASLARSRAGDAVWEAPRITTLSRWLIDTWTAGWPDAQLLSSAQELVLWREAVERDEAGAALLAPQAAAREARRADQILRRHAIDLETAPAWQDEHQAFRRWRQHVSRRMHQNRWLTGADIAAEVAQRVAAGDVAVPAAIHLAGFVAPLAPSEQAVLDALAARGTRIQIRSAPPLAPRVLHQVLPDEEDQWRQAVHEVRERLQACGEGLPPRIVFALPDPDAQRELGESVLRDLLAPWAAAGEGALPWRWERGLRLNAQAQVDILFALLQLRAEGNASELLSRVLLSTSLWTETERAHTAHADARLREEGRPRVSLARVAALLPPVLAAPFEAFIGCLSAAPSRALPSQWAAHFRALAEALGWPGADALDSQTYQAVHAARGLFDRLGTLDAQLGRVPASSARDWLAELARGTPFAPRVEHAQPLLITTLDEAAALSCDLLYVFGATAAQVPPLARPTPFLPLDLQRRAGVAEASPEAWLARAQAQAARLLGGCAPEVRVCMPAVDARGAQLQPSSLFGGVDAGWTRVTPARRVSALEAALSDVRSAAEWPLADEVPAVDDVEQAALRPDSALFRAWFESPFFAFCRYRLGIEPLAQPVRGLDARVQGKLVHAVLEDAWGLLRDSAGLAAADEATLTGRVDALVAARLDRLLPAADFGKVVRALEAARARDVVLQWLQHERERLDPFRVEMREVRAEPQVAGLQLRLRLDRVDCVQTPLGERWLVIDYKTGREADPRGWKVERPLEPQLPLYASHAATRAAGIPQVDGICFGHVKDGHPALVALTSWRRKLREEPLADLRTDWDERLGQWRLAMEGAARGFLGGAAWIDARLNERSSYADLLALAGASADDDETDAP